MRLFLRAVSAAAIGTVLLAVSVGVLAQEYPSRPIRFVLPYGPGIATDVLARVVTGKLAERLGWTVVIDNRPGGRFIPGAQEVLRSPADGYTVFVIGNSITVLAKILPFDIVKDFAPVAKLSSLNLCLVTSPKAPFKTLAELIAHAKTHPGKLNFAGSERGSNNHLAGEVIKQVTGIDMQHIAYKDTAYIGDIMAGRTDLGVMTLTSVSSALNSGLLRGIAVLGAKRDPAFKDIPTFAESGFPVLDLDAGNGFMVKSGTPAGVITRLNKEIVAVLEQPDVRERFAKMGAIPESGSAEAYGRKIVSDVALWQKVMNDAKITLE